MKTNSIFLVFTIMTLAFCACKKDNNETAPAAEVSADFRDGVTGNYQCSCYYEKKTISGVYVNDSTERSDTTIEVQSSLLTSTAKKLDNSVAGNISISAPDISLFLSEQYLSGRAPMPSSKGPYAGASFIGDSMYCDYLVHSGYHPKGYGTYNSYLYKCKKNK